MNQCNAAEKLHELNELKRFLEQHIRLVDDEIHVIRQAINLVREPTDVDVSLSETADDTHQGKQFEPSPYRHSGRRRAHIEVARDAALANGGQVHLTSVAKKIISSGMSDTKKPSSVAANLHKAMTKSNDWEWVEPGVFRLLSYEPVAAQMCADGVGVPADREGLTSLGDIRPVDAEVDN